LGGIERASKSPVQFPIEVCGSGPKRPGRRAQVAQARRITRFLPSEELDEGTEVVCVHEYQKPLPIPVLGRRRRAAHPDAEMGGIVEDCFKSEVLIERSGG